MTACALRPAIVPAPLIQIRRTFEAGCGRLRLSVLADSGAWLLRVSGEDGRTLYAAQRSSLGAAKVAATEFALWSSGIAGQGSPEVIAKQLTWRERW